MKKIKKNIFITGGLGQDGKILVSLFMLLATLNSCDSSKKAIENSKKMQEPISETYNITNLEIQMFLQIKL